MSLKRKTESISNVHLPGEKRAPVGRSRVGLTRAVTITGRKLLRYENQKTRAAFNAAIENLAGTNPILAARKRNEILASLLAKKKKKRSQFR